MEDQNAKELHEPGFLPDPENEPLVQGEENEEELSATDRILYVVTSPKRAFRGLQSARLGSVIGLSMLVGILILIGSVVLMFSSSDMVEQVKEGRVQQMEKMLDNPDMSEEQKEGIEEGIADIENSPAWAFMLFGSLLPAIGILIVLFIIALVVFVIAKIFESGHETRVKYSHALAVTSLSWIVSALGGLVFSVLAMATTNFDLSQGIGTLVGSDSGVTTAVVGALGPNSIWWYVVTGIGIATIARTSVAKASITFAFVVIVIAALLGMLSDAFGGMFG